MVYGGGCGQYQPMGGGLGRQEEPQVEEDGSLDAFLMAEVHCMESGVDERDRSMLCVCLSRAVVTSSCAVSVCLVQW